MAGTQFKAGLSGYIPLRPSWDLNTKLQQSSKTWLQEHGLERQHLTLEQILARTGFKQKSSFVKPLGREVSSRYAGDAFSQQRSPASGELFNVVNKHELDKKERQLLTAIAKLKARIDWVTSGSRETCGTVTEASVVLLFHAPSCPPAHLPLLLAVAKGLVEEQFSNITSFNIVRCQTDIDVFSDAGMVDSTTVFIQSAVKFLSVISQTPSSKLGPALSTSLQHALQLAGSQAVYLFASSEAVVENLHEFKHILQSSPIPVHFICLCGASQRNNVINTLKELSSASHGRYRIVSTEKSTISQGIHLEDHNLMQKDVVLLEEELDSAKDTLAEVQALLLEMKSKKNSLVTTKRSSSARKSSGNGLTSEQWIKIHGLTSKKLLFTDLLTSLAFRHCEAEIDLPTSPPGDVPSQIPSKLIGAKYCRSFIHLRWPDGKVYHVSLSDVTASRYIQQVNDVIRSCEKRLDWLQRGSRRTFGIVTAHKVAIVVDTSISIKENFRSVKDNLSLLLQEQLNTVHHFFTLVQCSSHTSCWREGLVPCTPQNLAAALQWVRSLQTVGTTNIMSALRAAIFMPSVEVVYLLTDGNPDQSVTQILSELSQWPHVPIHTVSFNHGDHRANKLLSQLAIATAGQFHCCQPPTSDSEPAPYKSEDVELTEGELSLAREQIEKAQRFQEECKQLQQKPPIEVSIDKQTGEKKKKKRQTKARSSSARVRSSSKSAGSRDDIDLLSSQASAVSLASSHSRSSSRSQRSRPSSAASEFSQFSVKSSGSRTASANREVGTKKSLESSTHKKKLAKHYKVLAQSSKDGFYYPATAVGESDSRHTNIKFADGTLQSVNNRHVIPTGGATARPMLQVGDHVLGRVRSKTGSHVSESGACDYYVPATICTLPPQQSASYSLMAYNKRQVRCLRRDIVKITVQRYKLTARMIGVKLGSRGESPEPSFLQATNASRNSQLSLPAATQSHDSVLIQQLLLEQQKQQALLLNQQELLIGLQTGHRELMERVQHRESDRNVAASSGERQWWIKKLFESSMSPPQPAAKNTALKSESTPNLGHDSERPKSPPRQSASYISYQPKELSVTISNGLTNVHNLQPSSSEDSTTESPSVVAHASVAVEACTETSPTYQSCGTNTHNLVDTGVNTAPLMFDICVGTEWATSSSSSSSSSEDEEPPKPPNIAQPPPQVEQQLSPTHASQKEQSNDVTDAPTQEQTPSPDLSDQSPSSIDSEQILNQEVLARSTDGYYYWGVVLQHQDHQDLYTIEELDTHQRLLMNRSDFITDVQDAAHPVLRLYDRAVAPRLCSPNCFLPGIVIGISSEGQYTIKLCDNTSSVYSRDQIYYLSNEKYDTDIVAIGVAQQQWIGQAVMARNDEDGFYYPGVVVEITDYDQFVIEHLDGSRYIQASVHVYGERSRRLPLCIGDHVIALYTDSNMALPGRVIGIVEKLLAVDYCNGERYYNVEPVCCFWIHPNYYELAEQYIVEKTV
ncbi:von Willebrand factor A domain-containing protein 3B-like isoform X2 [Dysidea avara]|uniref:von Willebrand factor A domain-containing protein 3B-like isoform X2 n=1 Tax=Dysidea avara TaxID=196820 RepID=UPI00331864FE